MLCRTVGVFTVHSTAMARADEVFRGHWGGSANRVDRTGYLRGTVAEARGMVEEFRALGCTRLRIALREGPTTGRPWRLRRRDRAPGLTSEVYARATFPPLYLSVAAICRT